jgi:subtilase-type serine protease
MPTIRRAGTALVVALPLLAAPSAHAQLSAPPAPITTYAGDPGQPGNPASWRTPEFLRDNGMLSIGAEFAYAAGYSGAGENIGIVDSGFFTGHMREHGSQATNYTVGDRYHPVTTQGGDTGPTSGAYDQAINDLHGTHVSGTVGASRDGVGETTPTGPAANMHGVAFNINVYLGNTGKTDSVFYGLLPATATLVQTPDNVYIGNVYRAVNAVHTDNNKPIRLITSSWGSQPATENYNTYEGLNSAWRFLSTPEGVADANGKTSHWLNGAIEVARTGTILQFTAGNGGYTQPTPRAAAPYFLPDLEHSWYTTSGINPSQGRTTNADGSVLVPGRQEFNQCGVAKWSCVTAPSRNINSTVVTVENGVPQPRYGSASGTSMAGPHSAAVLALIMQRFPYMTNEQALHTMYTTGRQNDTVNNAAGTPVQNPTRGQMVQVPDTRNGWNTVSLRDAFHGPGQLLGPVDLDTHGYSDVWSNTISDVAIQARQQEDATEAATWAATKTAKGWTNGVPADASDADKSDYAIGTRREQARNTRVYQGSLTKRGDGTLFLTGNETWHGPTTVAGGKLSLNGSSTSPITVTGGTLGGGGTAANVTVIGGTLQPGLAADEASRITDVHLNADAILDANDVRIGPGGRLAIAARSASDYTSVHAAGDLALDGPLAVDVQGTVTPGAILTIASGRSLTGTFDDLPEGAILRAGGTAFRVSYLNNAATLTVVAAQDGTISGTVPATLSLTLGGPASFGAFTPGVTKDYSAQTTANVISTAGDAALSSSDPGHLTNGAFSLPSALTVELSKSAWTGPASNDPVTIAFKQHIDSTDALRTGTYSRTVTFTLSTTTP